MSRRWLAVPLVAALVATPAAGRAPRGVPKAVVREAVHDFGTIEQGDVVSHVFQLENAGSAPLRIENVKSSCGCTVALADGHRVAPGSTANLSVRLDSARLVGRATKEITVYTDDPGAPSVTLTLTGQVATDILAAPAPLYLGKVRRGQGGRREIRVTAGRPQGLYRVSWIENGNPNIRAVLEAVGDDLQRVVVEIDPRMPVGRVNDRLLLHTTSPRQPTLAVPVFGSIEGDVVVLPPQVTFGIVRGGREERTLHIRNDGARPVAVTRVEAPERVVATELDEVEAGREYRVRLRLREGLAPGRVEASLHVFTDHPDEADVVVPIYAIVRADRS